jgi:hypothetical protein
MADKKVCFVIGPLGEPRPMARQHSFRLFNEIILPVFQHSFLDWSVQQAASDGSDLIIGSIVNQVLNADLVIADVSFSDANTFYELGMRHMAMTPVIHMLEDNQTAPFDVALYRAIIFSFNTAADIEKAQNDLNAWLEIIEREIAGRQTPPPSSTKTPANLAARVDEIAKAIADLRINSISEYVDQLQAVGRELRRQTETSPEERLPEATKAILRILSQIDHVIGSSRLGKLVLAGAIAGLATGGGLAAAAVFTLSLAIWDGPAAFKAAIEKFNSLK